MTIPFTGAGSLFVRVGHQAGWLNAVNTARGTTWKTNVDNIYADFTTYPDSALVNGLLGQYNSTIAALDATGSYIQGLTQNTLVQMVYDDVKLNSQALAPNVTELVRQMVANAASVATPTISTSVSAGGSNVGNGQVIASKLNIYGVQIDYLYAENIIAAVTNDSYSSNPATAYEEPIQFLGQFPYPNGTSNFWPTGSGANLLSAFVDPAIDASQTTNLLTNSDYQTFTVSNTPDQWPITVGSAGSTIFNGGSGDAFLGSGVLQFTGNGSELTAVLQQFNASSGTTAKLYANTVYGVGFWTKVDSVPAAGVLQVSLVNGTGTTPTIVADDATTDNATTVSLPGETTSYAFHSAFFRTPKTLPSTLALRVRLSTALTNARKVYIGGLVMTPAVQVYTGGPYAAAIAGNIKADIADRYTLAVANNAGTTAWQYVLQRLWSMNSLYPLQIPSSGSPTIATGLIT